MTIEELQQRAISTMEAYATAASEYEKLAIEAATTEHAYRKKKAEEMTLLAADTETKRTDTVKLALVDKATDLQMLRRNLAEAVLASSKIRIDQYKTEISLLQSLLRLETSDRDMNRYGQGASA